MNSFLFFMIRVYFKELLVLSYSKYILALKINCEVNSAPKTAIPPYLEKLQINLKQRKPLVGRTKAL